VLDTHREQLTEDIAVHTENIEQHQSIVHGRIVALKQDIVHYEEHIVASAVHSKQYQEDAVKFKQAVRNRRSDDSYRAVVTPTSCSFNCRLSLFSFSAFSNSTPPP
jgi:hypothetical protein